MPDTTHKLTAAMAAGDAEAVETFYRRYFDWLYAQARRATRRDESFCLDVVQDAVLRIVRTVRAVDSEARFRAWLKLVVKTTAFDLLRAEQRRVRHELVMATMAPGQDESIDEQQYEWLKEQLMRADPKIVRLIELRFQRGLKLHRMAKILGLSIGTIDGRLRRALKDLRQRATEDFDE